MLNCVILVFVCWYNAAKWRFLVVFVVFVCELWFCDFSGFPVLLYFLGVCLFCLLLCIVVFRWCALRVLFCCLGFCFCFVWC